ncbi:imidazoleglycerol-phosphate dehydratase HisB [Patulibacter defluvii]|uniref:imidazoleglycerol-phosphate dehydratase HisB n=1 Tax=Patulibacter defluvii TaxID=3095358 RepID=UPI002A74BCF3|nr:imidazoleglycerol-phosphate dehydratase HisB [Patulibacter sp. DM4]
MTRSAQIERTTGETRVAVDLTLDGSGEGRRSTGVGFFDHLLDLLARHAGFDLTVEVTGDLQTGSHHTVEDTGLVLGQALFDALGDRVGLRRYGSATIPMDEARAACHIDLSGRPFVVYEDQGLLPAGVTGGFEHELLEEFVRALSATSRSTIHLEIERGRGAHHIIEAGIKALARALRVAVSIDPAERGVPSTKGTLTA